MNTGVSYHTSLETCRLFITFYQFCSLFTLPTVTSVTITLALMTWLSAKRVKVVSREAIPLSLDAKLLFLLIDTTNAKWKIYKPSLMVFLNGINISQVLQRNIT